MRVGMVLPFGSPAGGPLEAGDLAEGARRIERHGFSSVWVFDAVGRSVALPDPLTALAVAATVTERVELGTGVLQLPLRSPAELAQRVATAQLVAGGRLALGVGAGSTEADFAAVGADYAGRFRTFARHLDELRRLLGDAGEGPAAGVWPGVQGGPPVLIGSWVGSRWITRAATEFDGWIGSGAKTSWSLLADGIDRYRGAGGRRAVVTNVVADLAAGPSPAGDDDPVDLRCPPDEARRRLGRLAALGFDDVVLVAPRHRDDVLEALAALAPR